MYSARKQTLEEAWVGDAVLSLYARQRILAETGAIGQEMFTRMTSNQFLATMGDPSEVEAAIGRIYGQKGLAAAFEYIERELMPMFRRQEENRLRKGK